MVEVMPRERGPLYTRDPCRKLYVFSQIFTVMPPTFNTKTVTHILHLQLSCLPLHLPCLCLPNPMFPTHIRVLCIRHVMTRVLILLSLSRITTLGQAPNLVRSHVCANYKVVTHHQSIGAGGEACKLKS